MISPEENLHYFSVQYTTGDINTDEGLVFSIEAGCSWTEQELYTFFQASQIYFSRSIRENLIFSWSNYHSRNKYFYFWHPSFGLNVFCRLIFFLINALKLHAHRENPPPPPAKFDCTNDSLESSALTKILQSLNGTIREGVSKNVIQLLRLQVFCFRIYKDQGPVV